MPTSLRTTPRYWIMGAGKKWMVRLFVALNVMVGCAVVLLEGSSLPHRLVEQAGVFGKFAVLGLAGLCLWAIIDVIVNDLLPAKYEFRFGVRYRHTNYMLMALGCLSMIFAMVKSNAQTTVLLHYGLFAIGAVMIAVLDIKDRLEERKTA